MANFTTTGVEDFLRALDSWGDDAERAIPLVLNAGADVAQERMENNAAWSDKTGELRRSLKRTKPRGSGNATYIEIYPSGTSSDGESLAEVGFVLEYGRGVSTFTRVTKNGVTKTYVSPEMAPHPWVRPAIEDNPGEIIGAMQKKWEEVMDRG